MGSVEEGEDGVVFSVSVTLGSNRCPCLFSRITHVFAYDSPRCRSTRIP